MKTGIYEPITEYYYRFLMYADIKNIMTNIRNLFLATLSIILITVFLGCVNKAVRESNAVEYGVLEGMVYVPLPDNAPPVEKDGIPEGYMPLENALVEVLGMRTYTDSYGKYRFSSVPVGTQTVKIFKNDEVFETLAIVQNENEEN